MSSHSGPSRVLITGASSGIGHATALYLAERGYDVTGTSRVIERLAGLEQDAANRGVRVRALELDINSDEDVDAGLKSVIDEEGGVDVLVNNAGYGLWGPVDAASMEQLKAQFETNFFAAFRLIKAVIPGMMERRRGTIVNVSSIEGRMATPFSGAYAASKFAMEGLSEAMRLELWPFGIRVALVEPGLFDTAFFDNQVDAEGVESPDSPYREYLEAYRRRRGRYDRLKSDPIKVARVIHKIIKSKRPRFRNPVAPEARLGILAVRFLPERLFQSLLARATLGRGRGPSPPGPTPRGPTPPEPTPRGPSPPLQKGG